MAIIKSVVLESGITASYWHPANISVDLQGGRKGERRKTVIVRYQLYKSKTDFLAGTAPLDEESVRFEWSGANIPFTNTRLNNIISDIDTKALTMPEFSGGVIE